MKKLVLNIFILLCFSGAFAQNAADVETSFGSIPGFNGIIYTTAQQTDGKILVGGNFTKYKGIDCKYFVRLLSDGTVDPSFIIETTFFYQVKSIVLQPDGKILVAGGYSTLINGLKDGVIRLNIDGSTDYSFSTIDGFNGMANIIDVLLQPNGKILIIGGFDTYNSINRKYIVRINDDGSLDTSFNPGSSFDNTVNSIALQADGKIVVVGDFDNYNGYTRHKIIRLNTDGTVDLTFSIGVGFEGSGPTRVLIQDDGKIVTTGYFSKYKNISQKNITRLLTNGDIDTTFNIGTSFQGSTSLLSLYDTILDNSGKIIIVGKFDKFNNVTKINCVRLNSDGSLDTTFDVAGVSKVYSILIQNDQNIILGGDKYISRVNNIGALDYTFDYGKGFNNSFGGNSDSVLLQPDGKIILGGYFTLYGLHMESGLIRLNVDGTKDNTFNVNYLDVCKTDRMILQPDGKIIVIGNYHYANAAPGSNYIHFMRLNSDGSQDSTFDDGAFEYNYSAFALQADGKILICIGNEIKRLNTNGTIDYSFNGQGFNGSIIALLVQPDDKIVAIGGFTVHNGEQYQHIVRLLPNGDTDITFNVGEGFINSPKCIALQPDGKILAGGAFWSYNVISEWGMARINTDGSLDTSFNTGTNNIYYVNSIVVQNDGKIVAGGAVSTYMGNPIKNLVRFNTDGSVDSTFDIGTGLDMGATNSTVNKLNLQSDGKILVSGYFNNYKSVSSSNLVRLYGGNSVLSNQNFKEEKLGLYPNPTENHLNVIVSDLNANYEIINYLGQVVKNGKLNPDGIEVTELNAGIYFLKVSSNKEIISKKFIKK